MFSLAKISPRELDNILPQLHNQLEWYDKVIRDAHESDGQEEGQSEGYQNFDSYTEDEDGNIFDPVGNLVTDESTIEGYYQSHSKAIKI